jgi:hypothetical protein
MEEWRGRGVEEIICVWFFTPLLPHSTTPPLPIFFHGRIYGATG